MLSSTLCMFDFWFFLFFFFFFSFLMFLLFTFRRHLTEEWRGNESDFAEHLPLVQDAIKFALRSGKPEEKMAALQTMRLTVLMSDGPFEQGPALEALVREGGALAPLALEVLAMAVWLASPAGDASAVDRVLELCPTVADSHRAYGLLASIKSDDDVVDVLIPAAEWLLDRFARAEGAAKVELGWTVCGLFCALHDARGGDYDPMEVDGFVNVGEFSDALRNVRPLKEVAEIFDKGVMPSENLVFNANKVVFEGFRQVLQVRFLRALLGVSFSTQMSFNQRLQELMGFSAADKGAKIKLSSIEKRLGKSPNSEGARNASKTKKKERERKMLQSSFGGEEAD